ncbi:hybrid sensor histidine kinase/response regulator [filamentous cyanobacterium LEGE 11480]|uniref:histidine kinase n=2 Tax=Romeriopsis TaxID=2992131 RepID=A0A928VLW0_9CYAN|nr:hybrid sensor histidine kinase/response regulator [Romeriopsis navalis LEGE 11480]
MTTPTMPNLWVVDDEENNLTVVELLLTQANYELSYFNSAMPMLEAIQHNLPDLILLDVMMPGIDGIELCRRLKQDARTKHVPIIMVTALSSREDLARCLDAGADDFISKPLNGLELRARVKSLLRIKRQYDELQTLVHLRDEMLNLRVDLSNMVIHDLRNPLANILLSCQIMQMRGMDDRNMKKIQQIEYSGHRLESMIDSLLVTAKLESGKLALQPDTVNLHQLIAQVMQEFRAIAEQQTVNLVQELTPAPLYVQGDATLLRRVLDNLLSNALKFAPAESEVTLAVLSHDQHVILQVRDQGKGVQPELREQIFSKFEIGQHLPQVKQMGLGLAFCKMVVEAHEGQIQVEDNQPKGCVFTIRLPRDHDDMTNQADPAAEML